jgi:hypothetical protein
MAFPKNEDEGMDSRRVVFGFMPPPFMQQPEPEERIPMDAEMVKEMQRAKLRNMHANARMQETRVLLGGLEEMRHALQLFGIAEGDRGSTERPPFETAFYEENKGKLQNAYLRLTERYLNYCEHMLVQQLDIKVTHEIKKVQDKQEPPAAAEAPKKKERKKSDERA